MTSATNNRGSGAQVQVHSTELFQGVVASGYVPAGGVIILQAATTIAHDVWTREAVKGCDNFVTFSGGCCWVAY